MDRTVIQILCPSRSGSTLLGNVLDGHPQILHIGEVVAPVQKGRPVRCRSCAGVPCPVWDEALGASFVRAAVARFEGRAEGPGPGELYERLFAAFAGIRFVVDGSKNLEWAHYHEGRGSYATRHLLLRRDLRGCFASWKRTAKERGAAPGHHLSVARGVREAIEALDALARSADEGRCAVVRYEELVADPLGQARRLCAWLDVPPDDGMADHLGRAAHLIGGNPGPVLQQRLARGEDTGALQDEMAAPQRRFYGSLDAPFTHDLRWREELTREDLRCFDEILGAANAAWGYR